MRWTDRILGIVLGVVLGVGVIVAFVFVFSEQTVDAPSLSGHAGATRGAGSASRHERRAHRRRNRPATAPIATVRVVGGAPPPAGPPALRYRRGELARLRIVSDEAVELQLIGYGPQFAVPAGQPTIRRFQASKPGDFALVAVPSHIDVARITVGPRK